MTLAIIRPGREERDTLNYGDYTDVDLVNDIPTHDDAVFGGIGSGGSTQYYGVGPVDFPFKMASITSVSVYSRMQCPSAATNCRHFVTLNSTDVFSGTFSVGTTWEENNHALSRPGGGSWTEADLRDPTFGWGSERAFNGGSHQISSLWLLVDFVAQATSFALAPHRELGARMLRMFQHTPETYQVTLPYYFLDLEVMDAVRLHDDRIPRDATRLDGLSEHGMADDWRGMFGQAVSIVDDLDKMELGVTVLNEEPYVCLSADTAAAPFDVNSDESVNEISQRRRGVMSLSAGAMRKEDRTDLAWIPDSSQRYGFVRLAKVIWSVAKMNNLGMLCEDAIGNDVLNSCFIDDLTGWTTVPSTGSIAISTDEQLFEDTELGQQVVKVTKGSGDTYFHRSFTTTATDRRICIWALSGSSSQQGEWAYQRNAGDWWNDTTESWDASIVWNALQHDADDRWSRTVSKLITGQGAGTGVLRIGKNGGLDGDVFYVGQVMSYEDERIFSDVLTDNSAVVSGGVADTIYEEIDNGGTDDRQVMNPDRVTYRVTMHAYQDEDGIKEGTANRMIIKTWRWNADGDRDEVAIEKVSGQVRIAGRRFRSSTEEALAFKNITLVRGQEYEITYRVTSPSDGELGLPARTHSVLVDGVKGTDDQSDGVHSSSTQVTQMYIGSTTSGIGLRRCGNWLRNWETIQRVLADEEVLGRRP